MFRKAKIIYGLIDPTLNEDTFITGYSSVSPFSKVENVLNNKQKDRLTYLEKDYFLLDGSFKFPNGRTREVYNVGYESANLSDAAGVVNEYIEFRYAKTHSSFGIQIDFQDHSEVLDFSIEYLKDNTSILKTEVQDNNRLLYSDYNTAEDWNRVKINITKIKRPFQRVRIDGLVFGISDSYDEDLLMSVTASKNVSITSSNTDSGEMSVSFYNEGRFNIKDIEDLPEELQAGVKVNVYFDEVLFGTYVVQETSVADEGRTIELTGYDSLYKYNETYYNKGVVNLEARSLYDWAVDVATDCGLIIKIDPAFQQIMSKGYIGFVPHREALRMVAEAGNGVIISNPDGGVELKKLAIAEGPIITEDDIEEDTLGVEDQEKVLGVKVNRYIFSLAKEKQGLAEVTGIPLTPEEQELVIEYAQYPALVTDLEYDATSSIKITSQEFYSDRAIVRFTGDAGDEAWITIIGQPYNTAKVVLEKGSLLRDYIEIDNTLITEEEQAKAVLDYQYKYRYGIYDYSASIVLDEEIDTLTYATLDEDAIIVTKIQKSLSEEDISLLIEGVDKPNE